MDSEKTMKNPLMIIKNSYTKLPQTTLVEMEALCPGWKARPAQVELFEKMKEFQMRRMGNGIALALLASADLRSEGAVEVSSGDYVVPRSALQMQGRFKRDKSKDKKAKKRKKHEARQKQWSLKEYK